MWDEWGHFMAYLSAVKSKRWGSVKFYLVRENNIAEEIFSSG